VGAFANRPILGKRETIFLTGHTGFKGTWLTLLLEAMGHEVIGYSLNPTPNSLFDRLNRSDSIQEFIGDIRDVDHLKKAMTASQPSMVIHMAAQPLVVDSYRKPRETFEINAQGTANVLEAAFSTKSVNVIGAVTTDKVYKNIETDYAYIETDALEGSSDPYSASKVGAEAAISAWRKIASISGGPRIATLRSGNVVGGGDFSEHRIIPDLVRSYISKVPVQIRNPRSTRPWMHVLDSLVGYLLALQKVSEKQSHEIFNFAPREKSLSVKEVLEIALEEWPGMFSTNFLIAGAQKDEAEFLNLNPDKAMKELNWEMAWDQKSAVQSSIHWWKMIYQRQSDPKQLCLQEIEKVLINA
jgi:CDP-glucose 4,6-dehydratase